MTWVFDSDAALGLPSADVVALLGGKAANLGIMARDLGLPVPPAFTISTEACRAFLTDGWPDGLDAEIQAHLATIETRTGRRFGDPSDPLLVSVRSGAPVSMPGMMDTILDLGLNEATERGLAAASHDPAFAADCHARFRSMFTATVGVDAVPEDPWEQLRAAIEAVFRSWNSDRAQAYRRREGISDDLGTAVTVQAMVFGNRGADSGSGVLFTRNPATGEPTAYGDVVFDAQGEDVVAGTHATESLDELARRMPAVAAELTRHATTLERHYADLCDIEFTIEDGTLWLLQCRIGKRSPQAALRIAVDMAEDPDFPLTRALAIERVGDLLADPPVVSSGRDDAAKAAPLATGLPASPGIATGEIVTTPEAAVTLADAGRAVILVRTETSPDDVHGMARAAGVLTSTGGLASHAAVVARGWGIPAVVGASDVRVSDDAVTIGSRVLALGTTITIDGSTGEVFEGAVAGATVVVPEAETLRRWAAELGIEIQDGAATREPDATPAVAADATEATAAPTDPPAAMAPRSAAGSATRPNVLATLACKGFGTPEALAEALFASTVDVGRIVDGLVAEGLVEAAAGSFRLSAAGKEAAQALLAEERSAWGQDAAATALDSFHVLDERVKAAVTAWQMRDIDGAQSINDHADAAYDAAVQERLAALHADAVEWLTPIAAAIPRIGIYVARLDRAARLAAGGDVRYMASPRVDSYHSAWFELHEDLILLCGRTRADEVAAGRA